MNQKRSFGAVGAKKCVLAAAAPARLICMLLSHKKRRLSMRSINLRGLQMYQFEGAADSSGVILHFTFTV